jgi:hypothetical protein
MAKEEKNEMLSAVSYKPKNRKLRIDPIFRRGGAMPDVSDNPNHDGRFMYTGTKLRLQAFTDTMGKVAISFEEGEQEYLEKALGLTPGELNPNKPKKTNFWCQPRTIVILDKNGIDINLSSPQDHIKWKIIESAILAGVIAPTYDERLSKPYKFMVVDGDTELNKNASKTDLVKDAWMSFGAISTSVPKMKNVLKIYNANTKQIVPKDASEKFLKTEINKIIDADPERFIKIVNDPNFALRASIMVAIEEKKIIKEGYKYFLDGEPDDKFTMDELVKYLSDPSNIEKLLKIKELTEE